MKKLTRFETNHTRQVSARAKPVEAPVNRRPIEEPRTPAHEIIANIRQHNDTTDQLHSEVGLTPSILRSALPQRFEALDTAKPSTDASDFFNLRKATG